VSTALQSIKQSAVRESALFVGLLFVGFVLMPVVIYLVGQDVFGAYGGNGYGDFFGTLSEKVRHGDSVAWFLILSPYLGWQCVRMSAFAWRASKM
jgi:hypothetical protein